LNVTTNIRDALLQLQSSGHEGYLWIDAITINQLYMEERNHEVNMMCETYEYAATVFVWLGQEEESAQLVISLLDRLAESALKAPRTYLKDDDCMRNLARAKSIPRDDMDQRLEFLGAPNLTDKERPAFSAFFNCRWFKRIWIIQEVALAARTEVSWEPRKICWETLSDAIEYWQIADNIKAIWRTPDEIRKRAKGAQCLIHTLSLC
jgi:Heterokaryon incompatibility protein (HET)